MRKFKFRIKFRNFNRSVKNFKNHQAVDIQNQCTYSLKPEKSYT